MTGDFQDRILWMRQAALLGAACLIGTPEDQPLNLRDGWPGNPDWRTLAERMEQQVTTEDWLIAAVAACELYPDAAAAFSILAEDQRQYLPTPASFACLATAGLGLAYDQALAAALARGSADSTSLIQRIDPVNSTKPLSQHGLRINPDRYQAIFDKAIGDTVVETEARTEMILHPVHVQAAGVLTANSHAIWLRASSRRFARHFALELASARGLGVSYFRPHDGVLATQDAAPGTLMVIDLFDVLTCPPLPSGDKSAGFVVIAPASMDPAGYPAMDVPELSAEQAAMLWENLPLPVAETSALSKRFKLTLPELRAALKEAETLISLKKPANGVATPPPDAATLEAAVLNAGARRMGHSVTRVPCDVTLKDLVARPEAMSQLRDAVNWHRNADHVWTDMGLKRDAADVRGLSLLFSGPPGGGKTFAARCLAAELKLNLYRIDLSQVVSKYIGETEKALSRVFDEAEAGHGLLLFDEADSIFGKRSEVKDAHDRYANIEVGFLLQRMESFDGTMVMATNLRANLDAAFLRRIRFIVDFPMPGREERRILWEQNLPASTWREAGLDVDHLADSFRLSGGNIRNISVAAAHLAAAQSGKVGPGHLTRALFRELEKSGLPRNAKSFGPLAEFLEGGL